MTDVSDRDLERRRYDERARLATMEGRDARAGLGAAGVPHVLRRPYLEYEATALNLLRPSDRVLEVAAGTGAHTGVLLASGAEVVATDIATEGLRLLQARWSTDPSPRLRVCACDMELLPFARDSFDVVAVAGSLSYGEPAQVDAEILRVLRRGGSLICVDSLNHNPVYRLNRWIRFKLGHRSASTLRRMPTTGRLDEIGRNFSSVQVQFFGGFSWALAPISRIVGQKVAASLSDLLDRRLSVRTSAFKFVLVARDRL